MIIVYSSKKVEKSFDSKYKKQWRYDSKVAERIISCGNFIQSAKSMDDLKNYAPFHLERLIGNRKNEWSIRVSNTGYRIIFIPIDENDKKLIDGDILALCKTIKIIEITEVSKHYE